MKLVNAIRIEIGNRANRLILLAAAFFVSGSCLFSWRKPGKYRTNPAYVQAINGSCQLCLDVWTDLNGMPKGASKCTTILGGGMSARNGKTFFTGLNSWGGCKGPVTKVTISQ